MPLTGYSYYRPLTDSNSVAGTPVSKLALTAANFTFVHANADGSDLRVYDETAGATVPYWLMDFNPAAQTATLWYKPADATHTHRLYYGNATATSVASFSGVYTGGSGFDADWGDLTTRTAASGTAVQLAASAGKNDSRERRVWRLSDQPVIAANVDGGTSVRELSIVYNPDGTVAPDGSGNWIAYYSSRNSNLGYTYRCQSSDGGTTWTGHTQVLAPGSAGSVDESGVYTGSVIKFGATDYRMWYLAYGTASPNFRIYQATSTDNATWTKGALVKNGSDLIGASNGISIPYVRRMPNGTYVLLGEGSDGTLLPWAIYGYTSADAATWTPLNSGSPLLSDTASTFYSSMQANPKLVQLPNGHYLMMFNGSSYTGGVGSTSDDWQIGFAEATALGGPYTADSSGPAMGRPAVSYGVETSGWATHPTTGDWITHVQDYSSDSSSARIYRAWPIVTAGGLMVAPATADACYAGRLLGASGTFTAEAVAYLTAHRDDAASNSILLGVHDSATVPAAGAAAGFARRVEIERFGRSNAGGAGNGSIFFIYWDTGAVRHFWNGSAWGTTTASVDSDCSRPTRIAISEDGTNFNLSAVYADDGSAIPSLGAASIAKASVGAFSSGNRCLVAGDPFTDSWGSGRFYRYVSVRPYLATEPAIAAGAEVVTAPPPTLSAGAVTLASSGSSGISMAATDASGGVGPYLYQWQRATGGASFANLANGSGIAGAFSLSLSDGSAAPGTLYFYRVIYTDSQGTPANATSNSASAQVYAGGPIGGAAPIVGSGLVC
jgi:hypothetical protein